MQQIIDHCPPLLEIRSGVFEGALRDIIDNDKDYAYYKAPLKERLYDADFIIGYAAQTDCRFTVQYTTEYSETFDLSEGSFTPAWFGTAFPKVGCPWFTPSVTIEGGKAMAIYAVLDNRLRDKFLQREIVFSDRLRSERGVFYYDGTSLGRPDVNHLITVATDMERRLRNEALMLILHLREMQNWR